MRIETMQCVFEEEIDELDEEIAYVGNGKIGKNEPLDGEVDFLANFEGDLNEFVSDCILRFFADKKMHIGGPINKKLLLTENYIRIVTNNNICRCILCAYNTLDKCDKITHTIPGGQTSEDTRLVIKTLEKCAAKNIPKVFSGGLMLMYLEFCEGLSINYNMLGV
jgi:hypothetical protein